MKPRSFSIMDDTPEEIIKTVVVPAIAQQSWSDLANFSQCCHLFFRSTEPALALRGVKKLLSHVRMADYDRAARFCDANPGLLLLKVKSSSHSKHVRSPLQLAIRLLDTRMWEMFWQKIAAHEHYKTLFVEQAKEQAKRYLCLQPLFAAYEAFHQQKSLHPADRNIEQALNHLGKMQLRLPMHMLKKFCNSPVNDAVDTFFNFSSLELMQNEVSLKYLASYLKSGPYALFRIALAGSAERATVVGEATVAPDYYWERCELDKLFWQDLYDAGINDLQRIEEYALKSNKSKSL